MIIFNHLIYKFLRTIYFLLTKQMTETNNLRPNSQATSENKVMSEIKNSADCEFVLKFDPPVYIQRYSAIQEILINSKWRGAIKKIVDFGCAEFGLFTYVKRIIGLQEILFVDVDITTLENYITRLYPLNADYLRRRDEPLNIKILYGSIGNPSIELMDVDAVICIEM